MARFSRRPAAPYPNALGSVLGVQHLALGGPAYRLPVSPINYAPQSPASPASPVYHSPVGTPQPARPTGVLNATPTGSQSFSNVPFQSGFQATAPQSTLGFSPGQFQPGIGKAQNTLSTLGNVLMSQVNGGGPNPAALQERQATDRNIAQAYAMAAADPNNPANARNVANQVGAANQQAAADSATQTAQQQLAAEQQLQGLGLGELGTSGSLMTDQEKLALEQNQGNQNAVLTAQGQNLQQTLANQALASGLLNQGIQAGAGLVSGAAPGVVKALSTPSSNGAQTADGSGMDTTPATPMVDTSGAGDINPPSAIGAAHGGLMAALMARHYAAGGPVAMTDPANPADYNYDIGSQVGDPKSPNLLIPSPSLGGSGPGAPLGAAKPAGGPTAGGTAYSIGDTAIGMIPIVGPTLSAIGHGVQALAPNGLAPAPTITTDPTTGKKTATNSFSPFNISSWMDGGQVPGRAPYAGDDERNDRVPAVLSSKEIVLPRSVTMAEDAPDKAWAFVRAIQDQQGKKKTPQSYGELLQEVRRIHARLDELGRAGAA